MKKTLITIVATVLVCACIVGGTMAWLMDTTTPVENTFTVGKVDITLEESELLADGTLNTSNKVTTQTTKFKMIPGTTIAKDPVVTVTADSESCWVYIKVVNTDTTSLTYNLDSWTPLEGVANVYYRSHTGGAVGTYHVFVGDIVNVATSVTGTTADATITITAYAVQSAGTGMDNAKTAWQNAGFN